MSSALAKTVAYMIFAVLLILFLNAMSYRETKKIHKNESSTKYIVSMPAVVNPSAIELPSIPKDTTNNAIDLYL